MKKRTNNLFSAVCVTSIVARFTTVVATGLWPVDSVHASHTRETAQRAVATGVSAATDLPVGSAKGSLAYDGATAELKFAAAFVDQKDKRKPIVLLISDQKLPMGKWESEFDMMLDHTKWSGVVFFLDKDGPFFRSDVHMNGRQSSVSGLFATAGKLHRNRCPPRWGKLFLLDDFLSERSATVATIFSPRITRNTLKIFCSF
jgi:hypothetical protein